MSRRGRRWGAAVAASALVLGVDGAPTVADDTPISGRVESVLELSLERTAPDLVRATLTATAGATSLSVGTPEGATRVVGRYGAPVARTTVTVRTDGPRQTITFGPQSP